MYFTVANLLGTLPSLEQGRAPLDNLALYCYRKCISLAHYGHLSAFRKLLNSIMKEKGHLVANLLSLVLRQLDGTDRVYHEGELALLNSCYFDFYRRLSDMLQEGL